MSVALLGDVYQRARAILNDEEAANWTDYKLSTKAVIAFEELEAELILAGIPIIHSISSVILVPALATDDNNLDLSTVFGYPLDLIIPISVKERQVGQQNRDFVDMVETDFIPDIDRDTTLHYWAWYQNTILVRGATVANEVEIRYQRYLPNPEVNTDSVIVPLAQLFLANRIAALAYYSVGNRQAWEDLSASAAMNLARIIDMNIKELQDLPAKRHPYHRGPGRNRVLRDF